MFEQVSSYGNQMSPAEGIREGARGFPYPMSGWGLGPGLGRGLYRNVQYIMGNGLLGTPVDGMMDRHT